jgi:3-phenylpropionate/trans-cinnamate dioxygenase ferredoxin reductase subunit
MIPRSIVIVGTGHAGFRSAEALRRSGWDGGLTLVGDEPQAPYDRTAVSKAMLFGAAAPVSLGAVDAVIRQGTSVTSIDRAAQRVTTTDGETLGYDHLILATGARPRGLAVAGDLPGVHLLRRASDAVALRSQLWPGARMLVVGGGLIGLEVASGATQAGLAVTVIEMLPRLMSRVLPEAVVARLVDEHRDAGIDIRTGTAMVALERDGARLRARLDTGDELSIDLVVVAIGVLPNVELAAAAGLLVADGICVDERFRTTDPAISAVGDAARVNLPMFGTSLRCESQQLAEEQGRYAARSILGDATAFAAVPWAWSDQYDKVVQVAGVPAVASRMVFRDFDSEGLIACHLADDGRLVAVTGFGQPQRIAQEVGAGRRLIARGARPPVEQFASTHTPLRALA